MFEMIDPKIYVVDDDASVRKALRRLLQSAGYNVETFASAEEFLGSEIQQFGTCLIVDIHLGGLSGLGLQEHLSKKGSKIPILFITAFDDEHTHRQMLKAGIPFLIKPFEDQKLIESLDALTTKQHNV
jgi:FixJ family two-component response regulator